MGCIDANGRQRALVPNARDAIGRAGVNRLSAAEPAEKRRQEADQYPLGGSGRRVSIGMA